MTQRQSTTTVFTADGPALPRRDPYPSTASSPLSSDKLIKRIANKFSSYFFPNVVLAASVLICVTGCSTSLAGDVDDKLFDKKEEYTNLFDDKIKINSNIVINTFGMLVDSRIFSRKYTIPHIDLSSIRYTEEFSTGLAPDLRYIEELDQGLQYISFRTFTQQADLKCEIDLVIDKSAAYEDYINTYGFETRGRYSQPILVNYSDYRRKKEPERGPKATKLARDYIEALRAIRYQQANSVFLVFSSQKSGEVTLFGSSLTSFRADVYESYLLFKIRTSCAVIYRKLSQDNDVFAIDIKIAKKNGAQLGKRSGFHRIKIPSEMSSEISDMVEYQSMFEEYRREFRKFLILNW